MNNSQARIVTVLDGMAYSLGTLIFLSGNEMVVNDNCMIMFHNFKGGLGGKGNELTSQLEATVKWFATLAKKIYIPFMSEEELARVLRGEDLWMQSSEIRRRLDKAIKVQAAAIEAKKAAKADHDDAEPAPKVRKTRVKKVAEEE
jgi:ATP-dependent protease ClpP protease subunit